MEPDLGEIGDAEQHDVADADFQGPEPDGQLRAAVPSLLWQHLRHGRDYRQRRQRCSERECGSQPDRPLAGGGHAERVGQRP